MKKTRRFIATVMALAMVLSMAFAVGAAEIDNQAITTNITIDKPLEGATYNAYKILNLSAALKNSNCHDTDADHESDCYNLAYSVNPKYQAVLTSVTGKNTEADILAYIGAMGNNSDEVRAFADEVYALILTDGLEPDDVTTTNIFEDAEQGYWLIEEELPDHDPDADGVKYDHSLVMLTTMGIRNITVTTKRDENRLNKLTYHDDKASWEIVGDNQIGKTVYFHTTSLVPDADGFTEMFTYVIHDEMGEGLTSNVVTGNTNEVVSIFVNATDPANGGSEVPAGYYQVYAGADGNGVYLGNDGEEDVHLDCDKCTFHVVVDIIKGLKDGIFTDTDTLIVSYSAVLNEDAPIYQTSEERENNKAHLEYSNNPYEESETKKTPEIDTFHYTFKFDLNKIDAVSGKQLENALFVLSTDGTKQADKIDANNNGVIDVSVDSDNSGTIDANEVGEEVGLIKFIKTTNHPQFEGETVYVVAPDDYAGETTYVIEAGSPVIAGLDDHIDYYLYEIKAPAGYNPTTTATRLHIFTEYNEDGSVAAGFPKLQIDHETSDKMVVNIANSTGTIMPGTGGIGTTLFYVFGGLLFAGAAILLITKKRMAV